MSDALTDIRADGRPVRAESKPRRLSGARRRALIVSPYFPPSTLAGVHRARILSKYLPRWGWDPVVVCVHERHHKENLDAELGSLVPADTRVIKVDAWPTRICGPLGLNDVGVRGYRSMKAAVDREIEVNGADLLFITVLPGLPMLMGPSLRRRHGIPFVIDYQDPWLPERYREEPFGTKRWLAYSIARLTEEAALKHADLITSVSDGTNSLLLSRYPSLDATPFHAAPIGGDADDFKWLRDHPRPSPILDRFRGDIIVSHVGTILPAADRTIAAVLTSLVSLKETAPALYQRLRLVFVGSSNQPMRAMPDVVMPLARSLGVADRVFEEPSRIPYLDALNVLVRSDIILMMGSNEPHYTASKLYPGLLSARPVLAVYDERSSVCHVAKMTGGVRLVTFGPHRPVETCVGALAQALVDLATEPRSLGPADATMLEPFLGPEIARQFAAAFDNAVDRFRPGS